VTSLADRKTVAGSWLKPMQYLGPQQLTQKTIADYLSRIVQYQPAVGSAEEHTFFETIVLPFLDGGRRDDETRAALLFLLVDGATQVIADLDSVLAERWAPYLAYCAGRAHCLLGRHSEGYARFRAATQNAIGNAQWKLGTIADSQRRSSWAVSIPLSLRQRGRSMICFFASKRLVLIKPASAPLERTCSNTGGASTGEGSPRGT